MGLCSMSVALDQDQRRSGFRNSMARALQVGLLQVPFVVQRLALPVLYLRLLVCRKREGVVVDTPGRRPGKQVGCRCLDVVA